MILENVITFVLVLILPCLAYTIISLTYSKNKEKELKKKLSGFEIARSILDNNDLKDLYIVEVKGNLNDHYDYNQKVIRLSTDVYHGETVTSMAVAAKIASYAILDKRNNTYMKFKFTLNPIINFAVYIAYILFILGICLQDFSMVSLASGILGFVLIFHLVTLPVEFNGKKVASGELKKLDKITKEEISDTEAVLKVANYTFVMSILTCISNLFSEIVYNIKRRG